MSLWRRNARKDENHAEIVQTLRAAGASVLSINAPGCPDLLVGWIGSDGSRMSALIEIKRPAGKRGGTSHSRLNLAQEVFHKNWNGPVPWVVRSPIEALAVLGYNPKAEP